MLFKRRQYVSNGFTSLWFLITLYSLISLKENKLLKKTFVSFLLDSFLSHIPEAFAHTILGQTWGGKWRQHKMRERGRCGGRGGGGVFWEKLELKSLIAQKRGSVPQQASLALRCAAAAWHFWVTNKTLILSTGDSQASSCLWYAWPLSWIFCLFKRKLTAADREHRCCVSRSISGWASEFLYCINTHTHTHWLSPIFRFQSNTNLSLQT